MKIFTKTIFKAIVVLGLLANFGLFNGALAATIDDAPMPFHPTANAMADIDNAIAKAGRENKLALILIGANWCHDSLNLIANFNSPEMSPLMSAEYEVLYVDVGFLENNMDIVTRFGLSVMFGTPTVLIVDPVSKQQINKDSMHLWLSSAKISTAETNAHFTEMLSVEAREAMPTKQSPQLEALLDDILAFESEQSVRISAGFEVVSPMLRGRVENEAQDDRFVNYWSALRQLRYGLPGAVSNLRAEAAARVASGEENIELTYPVFANLPWE